MLPSVDLVAVSAIQPYNASLGKGRVSDKRKSAAMMGVSKCRPRQPEEIRTGESNLYAMQLSGGDYHKADMRVTSGSQCFFGRAV